MRTERDQVHPRPFCGAKLKQNWAAFYVAKSRPIPCMSEWKKSQKARDEINSMRRLMLAADGRIMTAYRCFGRQGSPAAPTRGKAWNVDLSFAHNVMAHRWVITKTKRGWLRLEKGHALRRSIGPPNRPLWILDRHCISSLQGPRKQSKTKGQTKATVMGGKSVQSLYRSGSKWKSGPPVLQPRCSPGGKHRTVQIGPFAWSKYDRANDSRVHKRTGR